MWAGSDKKGCGCEAGRSFIQDANVSESLALFLRQKILTQGDDGTGLLRKDRCHGDER